MLLIVNWAWLQLFVLWYMEYATSPAKISIGVLIFNTSEAIFGGAVKFVMQSAEVQRTWRETLPYSNCFCLRVSPWL